MTALDTTGQVSHSRGLDFGKKIEMSGLLPPRSLPHLFPNMYRHGPSEPDKLPHLHSLVFRHQFPCQPSLAELHRGLVDLRGRPHPSPPPPPPPRVPPVMPTFSIKDILASESTPIHKPIPRHPSSCSTCRCIQQDDDNANTDEDNASDDKDGHELIRRVEERSMNNRASPHEPVNSADSLKFGIQNILSKTDDVKVKGELK